MTPVSLDSPQHTSSDWNEELFPPNQAADAGVVKEKETGTQEAPGLPDTGKDPGDTDPGPLRLYGLSHGAQESWGHSSPLRRQASLGGGGARGKLGVRAGGGHGRTAAEK